LFDTAVKRSASDVAVSTTFAALLVLGGVDIVTVKELMGHSDISTTMRYSHASPESKRRAVELLSNQNTSGRSVADGSDTQLVEKHGAPETTRTSDTRFRKPLLYPS
jgi:hypothetical protein